MGRTPCCSKMGLNRGPWTPEEDQLLCNYIQTHGEGRWRTLPKKAGLLRCGKSCRLRWMNYLRPDVKRGQILPEEEDLILRLHRLLGNRWSLIAGRIPGRTDNEIKNYWNTHLSKKLISQGIDPRTHKPLAEPPDLDAHANNDADNNQVDSENNPQHKYGETGIVADNDASIEDQNSQELGELPENSVTGNLHALNDTSASSSVPPSLFHGQALNQETSEATYNINATLIPYSNATGDPSLYLRKNSVTNSYFMAPPPADSALQNNPSLHGSISRNAPDEGFPLNFGQSEMQQHQVGEGTRIGVIPTSASGDYYSDIFSYFLESFTGEDQLHEEENKHGAPLVSENRQTTSVNQLGCEMWSTVMSPPSQCP